MTLVKGFLCSGGLAAMLVAGVPDDARAQEAPVPAQGQTTPSEGELIYARDVHHSVGDPYFPGPSHTTQTAPTRAITETIANGLAPINDIEAAAVTGSLSVTMDGLVQSGLTTIIRHQTTSRTEGLVGEHSAAFSGGSAISGALGALNGALDSLAVINGGQP